MESIKFYKLVSPYPEDVTMNCKLTMTDMDDNFLAFKDNDISAATFNAEELMINVIRNNGEEINIDISDIKDNIHEQITSEISGITEIISGTTLNPQPYTYYVGTSDLDDIDSETITSNFEKKEGKASMVYHNLHVHNGEYIWVVLPDNMEIIEIMSDGMIITLDYEIQEDMLVVSVQNDYDVIPREKLKTLFDKFTRVDDSTTRTTRGTGLGLFIVKGLVEAMNGEIRLYSNEEYGFCVKVFLHIADFR